MSEGERRPSEAEEPKGQGGGASGARRVFLSYSHDTPEHKAEVLALAQRLRAEGIDAWVDQFEQSPPAGWPRWTREQLDAADFVLVVCSEVYRRRFEGRETSGQGQGANWEGLLTEARVYRDDGRNLRFLPLLLSGQDASAVPEALQTATCYRLPDDYDALYRRLTEQPAVGPAALGAIKQLAPATSAAEDAELSMLREQKRRLALAGVSAEEMEEVDAKILVRRRQLRDVDQLGQGSRLCAGRFELVERIGYGGFGTVWKAWDVEREQRVAIKLLHPQYRHDRTRRERFFRGAKRMASLEHPGVVGVVVARGQRWEPPYFVMEFVGGRDLQASVRAHGAWSSAAVASLMRVVGGALAHAHARGQVHRDVKPANILLSEDGAPKLTDFDLVRAADTTGGTRTGALGTFLYAPPEALSDASQVDERADVYSLGMTAAFALHGGDLPPVVMRDSERFLAGLDCAEPLREVLRRACAWEREERYPGMRELVARLPDASRLVAVPEAVARSEEPTPAWATNAGEDDYGRYADLELAGVTQRMRWIPGGSFVMGSPATEAERGDNEGEHEVSLRGFWLADTACTQALWRAVMGDNPSYFQGEELPVERVSWEDCQRFLERCRELSPDLSLQLPTEAQWEYACRAGTRTPFSFGATITPQQVNYHGAHPYAGGPKGERRGKTVEVEALPCNGWGLYQMHGNVWEWCADWYERHLSSAQRDPVGPAKGRNRVVRGGSCFDHARGCRSAYRGAPAPGFRFHDLGFRLAAGQEPGEESAEPPG